MLESPTDYMVIAADAALQNHNIIPSDFLRLSIEDRAAILASDKVHAKKMKKLNKT